MAVGRGRRDPVQGRGVRLDASGGAAPAGVDRSARPQARLRRPGAPRSDQAAPRRHSDRLPVRPGGERAPRSGSTSRSACSTCSTTARSSCEDTDPGPSRARRLERGGDRQRRPSRRGALCSRHRGGARARPPARRPSRSISGSARGSRARRDAASLSADAGRPTARRAAPRRDRLRRVRGRHARRLPRLGVGAAGPTLTARAGVRAGRAPRFASPTAWRRCSTARPHRPRRQPRAARSLRARRRGGQLSGSAGRAVSRTPCRTGSSGRASSWPPRRSAPGRARRGSPIPHWWMTHAGSRVDAYFGMTVRRLYASSRGPRGRPRPRRSRLRWLRRGRSRADEPHAGRADELRRGYGAVRAHARDDDARVRQEAVVRRRRRVRHAREAGPADGRSVVVRRALEEPRLEFGGTIKGDLGSPEDWKLEAIQDGDTAYINFPLLAKQLPAGKTWIKGDAKELSERRTPAS